MSLSIYLPSFMTVFGASFIAFASPGPNFVGIVSAAIQNRPSGIFVAVGVTLGTAFWSILAITGVTAAVSQYPSVASALQVIGGGYLTWLGIKSLLTTLKTRSPITLSIPNAASPLRSLTKGLLIQITNPKSAMFWLSMMSGVILPDTPAVIGVILVTGTTLIALAWHLFLATAFSFTSARDLYLKIKTFISLLFGIAFIALGLKILLQLLS